MLQLDELLGRSAVAQGSAAQSYRYLDWLWQIPLGRGLSALCQFLALNWLGGDVIVALLAYGSIGL